MARQRTRDRVHAAVVALASERTLGSITMEALAAAAGVSKQTLYRSWSSTGAVLFDALLARSLGDDGTVPVPNTGDLRVDLKQLGEGIVTELSDPVHDRLLRAVTAELQGNDALARDYRELLLEPQMRAIAQRFAQAQCSDPDAMAELFAGPILHRWLLRGGGLTDEWVRGLVDRVVALCRWPRPHAAGRRSPPQVTER